MLWGGGSGGGALLEVDGDGSGAGIGGSRGHIYHVFDAVERLLEWDNDAFHDGLGVGTGVGGLHPHGRGRDVGKLLDGELQEGQHADAGDQNGNDAREDGAIDESLYVHVQNPWNFQAKLRV